MTLTGTGRLLETPSLAHSEERPPLPLPHPDFTLGLEEEYLLVDLDTLDLAPAPEALMREAEEALADQVSPEFLQCQIEVGTRVSRDIAAAREDLRRLRSTLARIARRHNLAPIAASCHPFARWEDQKHTPKERYDSLARDLAGVVRRMLICGMHTHVGIGHDELRIDLLSQFPYFLPHLLALSCSSPFWRGHDTGLQSYRLTIFDNLPRTGLPPRFSSWSEYERSIEILIANDIIEDSSKIWWDVRPSARFPTIESRICDVSPRLEDALAIAALTQSVMRMLWRLRMNNQRWRIYDRFLVGENRWRAQRYGPAEGLIDFARGEIVPYGELLDELITLVAEDAEALGCLREIEHARSIVTRGTSAMRQRAVRDAAVALGDSEEEALRKVVLHLIEEFEADL